MHGSPPLKSNARFFEAKDHAMIKKLGEKIKVVVNVVEDDEMDCY